MEDSNKSDDVATDERRDYGDKEERQTPALPWRKNIVFYTSEDKKIKYVLLISSLAYS
jgi:hypothetical protein